VAGGVAAAGASGALGVGCAIACGLMTAVPLSAPYVKVAVRYARSARCRVNTHDATVCSAEKRSTSGPVRSLDDRIQGTRLLLQRHAIVVACQTAMFLLALLTQELR